MAEFSIFVMISSDIDSLLKRLMLLLCEIASRVFIILLSIYVAFGKGDDKDANELAEKVTEEKPIGGSVSPADSLATTWGKVRIVE
jgi:hypothetical protein